MAAEGLSSRLLNDDPVERVHEAFESGDAVFLGEILQQMNASEINSALETETVHVLKPNRFKGDSIKSLPLIVSVINGNLDFVKVLLKHKPNVESRCKDGFFEGFTPLGISAALGHADVVGCLLENGAAVNACALMSASENGHVKVATALAEHGANLDFQDKDGCTPLMRASENNLVEMVAFLVEHGANIDLQDKDGHTPLMKVCKTGHADIVAYLIEHGATKDFQDNCGCTPLMIASNYSHMEIVNYLVEQGANLDVQDNKGNTALHYAVLGNSSVAVCSLLSFGACQLYNSNRLTPLLLASNHCKISLVEDLIKRPECSREQRIDALELLGASLDLTGIMPETEAEAAFQYIKRGMEERFKNNSDPILKQPLQPVKAYQNKIESQTLEELALIELSDTYTQGLECLLIKERILGENNIELLEAIRSLTNELQFCDESYYDLCVGLCRHAMKIAQCCNQPVSIDIDYLSYFFCGVFEESKNLPISDVLEVLDQAITAFVKEKEKTTVESESGLTKLFENILQLLQFLTKDELCGKNKNPSVSCILQKLCALNPRDEEGNTLLHIAAASRDPGKGHIWYYESTPLLGFPCIKTVQLLLDAGFNVNELNNNGDTPLHRAAMFNPHHWTHYHLIRKMLEVLLLGGAHLDYTNNDGLTAMDKSRNVRAESFLSYQYNRTLSKLKCISARAVKKYGLPYFGEVPKSLEKYISMH